MEGVERGGGGEGGGERVGRVERGGGGEGGWRRGVMTFDSGVNCQLHFSKLQKRW